MPWQLRFQSRPPPKIKSKILAAVWSQKHKSEKSETAQRGDDAPQLFEPSRSDRIGHIIAPEYHDNSLIETGGVALKHFFDQKPEPENEGGRGQETNQTGLGSTLGEPVEVLKIEV